jgi:hypothetical protein
MIVKMESGFAALEDAPGRYALIAWVWRVA